MRRRLSCCSITNDERHAEYACVAVLTEQRCLGADYQVQALDVICGRGRGLKHSGNLRLRVWLETLLTEDARGSFSVVEKVGIVKKTIKTIRNCGGNFIKFTEGRWVDVGHVRAHQLVAQFLRLVLEERHEGTASVFARKRSSRYFKIAAPVRTGKSFCAEDKESSENSCPQKENRSQPLKAAGI